MSQVGQISASESRQNFSFALLQQFWYLHELIKPSWMIFLLFYGTSASVTQHPENTEIHFVCTISSHARVINQVSTTLCQSASEKGKQWSDLGPIKVATLSFRAVSICENNYCLMTSIQSQPNARPSRPPLVSSVCHIQELRLASMTSATLVDVPQSSLAVNKTRSLDLDSGNRWTCLFVQMRGVALKVFVKVLADMCNSLTTAFRRIYD